MNFTYNHVAPLQFLRTTYKAGPLLALALAGLGGLAAARAAPWLRARGRALPLVALTGLAALAAVACWPLVRGQALDSRLTWERIPAAWTAAADHVDAAVGEDGRAVVLPGPALRGLRLGRDGRRDPARARRAPRRRALRGALRRPARGRPAVDGRRARAAAARAARPARAAAGPAVARARWWRGPTTTAAGSGAVGAADAADVLDQLGAPDTAWGPVRREPRAAGTLGAPRDRCRACVPGTAPAPRPMVRLEPDSGATVVDGSADALAGLAALGALPRGRIAYAGDLASGRARGRAGRRRGRDLRLQPPPRARGRPDGAEPRRHARRRRPVLARRRGARPVPGARRRRADGGDLRRRALPAHAVLARLLAVPRAAPVRGLRRRPRDPLAGRPRARGGAPLARDRLRRPARRRLDRAAAVLRPAREGDRRRGRRPHVPGAAGLEPARARAARRALAAGADRARARRPRACRRAPGGIRELRIPGVHVREALRPPVLAERALAGRDLDAHRPHVPVRAHRRATTRSGATRAAAPPARCSCATARTASAGSSA